MTFKFWYYSRLENTFVLKKGVVHISSGYNWEQPENWWICTNFFPMSDLNNVISGEKFYSLYP